MTSSDHRETQTQIKHEILEEYIGTWGGIIANGIKATYWNLQGQGRAANFITRFVYVDCFSYTGVYESETDKAYGSPIIGIRSLDKLQEHIRTTIGFNPTINIILAEEDPKSYKRLLQTLEECGFSNRVKENPQLSQLTNQQIAVFSGDYRQHIDQILRFTGKDYTWSLFLLDPYGARGIDLSTVSRIIKQEHTDTIIYFPHYDLSKKLGVLPKDNPQHPLHKHLQHYDTMFGSKNWREEIKPFIIDTRSDYEREYYLDTEEFSPAFDTAMQYLVSKYETLLRQQDQDLAIKKIQLKFPSKERTMYYLFLTTHDGTGALRLNEILHSAYLRQFAYRDKERLTKSKTKLMFDVDDMLEMNAGKPEAPEVDVEALAVELHERYKGSKLTRKDLFRLEANSDYYPQDLDSALKHLKRTKRVTFTDTLVNSTMLFF